LRSGPANDRVLSADLQPLPRPKEAGTRAEQSATPDGVRPDEGLSALKREFAFLKDPPNHPLQQAIHDLHKAFKNFFEGRAGFPKFRRKGENDSFR
jgi:hypothetical protein